jgi:AcrR family transcriptional regulator
MPIREPPARRERAREHARRDILLAAAEVFARRGYAAATLAELAEAAGFAPPSLYRYFSGKEEMFRSLVDLLVGEMDATFEEPVDRSLPLAARLEQLVRSQIRLTESLRSAFALLQGPAHGASIPSDSRIGAPGAGLAYYENRVLGWLRRNAARSELRPALELAARAIASVALAFGRSAHPGGSPGDRAHLIVDLALNGIAAPAGRRGVNP